MLQRLKCGNMLKPHSGEVASLDVRHELRVENEVVAAVGVKSVKSIVSPGRRSLLTSGALGAEHHLHRRHAVRTAID
jgi:hypothetical protein